MNEYVIEKNYTIFQNSLKTALVSILIKLLTRGRRKIVFRVNHDFLRSSVIGNIN
jgi:hypothetical protein